MNIVVVIANHGSLSGRLKNVTKAEVVSVKPGLADNVLKSMLAANRNITLTLVAEDVEDDHLEELGYIVQDYFDVPIVAFRHDAGGLTDAMHRAGFVEIVPASSTDVELQRMVNRYLGVDEPGPVRGRGKPKTAEPAASSVTDRAPSAAARLGLEDPDAIEEPPSDRQRVIVVMSPKGGVGKTTISTNLAVALSQRAPLDTLIVDFDSQFGDVASVLNINATHTLEQAFTDTGVQSSLVVKGMLNSFQDRLLVLAGSESPAALEKITSNQETLLLRQLAAEYTYIVIDTGSGLTDETLAALEVATDVLFVTTMDISAVKALRRAIDLLDRIDLLPRNRHLVVNMAEPGTGLEVEDISRAMRMPVDATVPRSVEIALSINLGKPIAEGRKAGELSAAVRQLVSKLTGETGSIRRGGLLRRD